MKEKGRHLFTESPDPHDFFTHPEMKVTEK